MALPVLAGASVLVAQRRRTGLKSSGSDKLLADSFSNEVAKMKKGIRREADAELKRPPAPRTVSSGAGFGSGVSRVFQSARSSTVGVLPRILGAACFVLPVVAAVPYGLSLFLSSPFLRQVVLQPLLPLIQAYHSMKYGNFVAIVGLYMLIGQNSWVHPFLRKIGLQAATLMMMSFPFNFAMQFLAPTPGPLRNLAQGAIFMYFLWCSILGAYGSLTGAVQSLPGIGDGTTGSGFSRPAARYGRIPGSS